MNTVQIIKDLSEVINNISEKKINNFKNLLMTGEITSNSDTYQLKSTLNLSAAEISLVKKILETIPDSKSLAVCLDLVSEIKNIKRENEKTTSLVWTSPFIFNERADNTKSIILEMINNSKHSVTFVGYVIQENTQEIFDALSNATKRGVKIRLLFEEAEKYVKSIRRMWKDNVSFPEVYSYHPKAKRSSLHAKVLIIDSNDILITSANLTGRGIDTNRNVEMGIRHVGKTAHDAEELIETLIKNNYLVKIDG